MIILVTGGCGFIGSNFINYLLSIDKDIMIYNIDCINYCSKESNINYCSNESNYKFINGDIKDINFISFILKEYKIEVIIHFAAQSHVDNSFTNSLSYTQDNVYGTHVMLQCSLEYGKLKKFIHFSTDEVYGEVDMDHPGCCEKSLLNPTNPYAATKAAAEMLVKSYYHSFKLPVVTIRCNNVYGINQYPEKLIPKFITMLKNKEKLTIHGNGKTRRNFIWTDDVSRAVITIIEKGELNTIYNIGTSQEYSVIEIAEKLINKICDNKTISDHILYVEDRPFNDFRYAIKSDMLKSLGWYEKDNDFDNNLQKIIDSIINPTI